MMQSACLTSEASDRSCQHIAWLRSQEGIIWHSRVKHWKSFRKQQTFLVAGLSPYSRNCFSVQSG